MGTLGLIGAAGSYGLHSDVSLYSCLFLHVRFVMAASLLSSTSIYYFNITDGEQVFPDEEGIELFSIEAALVHAAESVEEFKEEGGFCSLAWQGWRLEVTDGAGQMVQRIPLDGSSEETSCWH